MCRCMRGNPRHHPQTVRIVVVMTPPFTAPPLVVFHDIKPCPRCDGDMALIFDGTRVYAETSGQTFLDVERDGTDLGVVCGNWSTPDNRVCGAVVHFDLTAESWSGWVIVGHGVDL